MSSILDALRRLEREAPDRPELPFDLQPEEAPPPSPRRPRWIRPAAVLLVTALVGTTLWLRRGDETPVSPAAPLTGEPRGSDGVTLDGERAPALADAIALAPPDPAAPGSTAPAPPGATAVDTGAASAPGQAPLGVIAPPPSDPAALGAVRLPRPDPATPDAGGPAPSDSATDTVGPSQARPRPGTLAPMLATGSATTPSAGDPAPGVETPQGNRLEIARAPETDRASRDARRSARERSAPLQRADERARLRAERRAQREAMIAERRRMQRARTVPQQEPEAPRAWQRVLGSPSAPPADVGTDPAAAVPEAELALPLDAPPGPRIAEPTEESTEGAREATAALPAPLDPMDLAPVPAPSEAEEPETDAEPARSAEDAGSAAAGAVPIEEAAEPALSAEEEILRKPPRGAPRVRVSFLFYSKDPGRRRVMLTLNDTPDLVTAYEGQRIEAFEIARILPDEVHLRYEGKVFAIQPRY